MLKNIGKRDAHRYKVGNILNKKVPVSKDESGNKIERTWGKTKKITNLNQNTKQI